MEVVANGAHQRPRNARGQGGLLRDQFVAAASELLGQVERPEQLTLRMVARVVDVSPASVYRHFPDLDSLVAQVLTDRLADMTGAISAAVAATSTPLEGLVARCMSYARWGLGNPGHYRVVFAGRVDPVLNAVGRPTGFRLIEDLSWSLAEVRRSDPAKSTPPNPTADGRFAEGLLLWSSMHGLISLRIDKPDLPWPPYEDHVAELVAMFVGWPMGEVTAVTRAIGLGAPVGRDILA